MLCGSGVNQQIAGRICFYKVSYSINGLVKLTSSPWRAKRDIRSIRRTVGRSHLHRGPHYLETYGRGSSPNTHTSETKSSRAARREQSRQHHRFCGHAQDQGEPRLPGNAVADGKGAFFFLVQSEDGDLFKVWLEHEGEDVRALKVKYFDTVPVASSLCILKSGYMFVASEFSDQYVVSPIQTSSLTYRNLYQFQSLADDDGEQEWSSTDFADNGDSKYPLPYAFFTPRPLQNLLLVDTLSSLDPITDAKVVNLLGGASDTPQIYAMCGKGPRSTFRTLRHGLDVSPVVASPLPGVPSHVWTLKLSDEGELSSTGWER